MLNADFALFNVDQLVTVAPGVHPLATGDLGVIERGALASENGHIVWVGPMDEFHDAVRLYPDATVVNTHGRTVLPGFVDAHTHPVFAGDRVDDFYRRAVTAERYEEQLQTGGIMRTVRETREKSEDALVDLAYQRADTFLQYGTTTIEAKTGYGLTKESELKSLRVLNRLQHLHPVKVVPAFLGAHVVPEGETGGGDSYVTEIVDSWLPEAAERAEIVDVWCEAEAFSEEQCRKILSRAQDLGMRITAHASELAPTAGIRLAVELHAQSVDHVVYPTEEDIELLATSDTVAVLLPGTTLFLGSDRYAPARTMIDSGVTVALATDFNPGTSYTQNMQLILSLAVLKLGMTPEEAVRASTRFSARAVGLEDRVGSLEPGKFCDCTIYCVGNYREIPYHLGMNLVETVVASGQVVVREGQIATLPHAFARPS